jgi:hypothetical protein
MVSEYDQSRSKNWLRSQSDKQLRQYLATLPPAERARYLAAHRDVVAGAPDNNQDNDPQDAQEGPQQAIRRPFRMQPYGGAPSAQQSFMDNYGPAAQARHLGGMIDDVQRTIQDENDSRVAQSREQMRMAHEQEMEAMRQEALLQRLAMEQQEREKDRILQKQLTTGVTTRKLVNGRWVDV